MFLDIWITVDPKWPLFLNLKIYLGFGYFDKLQERELELNWLVESGEGEDKNKGLALKAKTIESYSEDCDNHDENEGRYGSNCS